MRLCRDLVVSFVAALVVLLTEGQSPKDALLAVVVAIVYGAVSALDKSYPRYGRTE